MHSIYMTHDDIRRTAAAMNWSLADTAGYRKGDVRGESQDAATLVETANPDAGLVFGFLVHGSDALPWREAMTGARRADGSVLARLIEVHNLSSAPDATGEEAFFDYVKVITEHFNALVAAEEQA